MPVKDIMSAEEFHKAINSDKVTIVEFWATWCGPSKAILPTFENLSNEAHNSDIEFYKVDVDDQCDISQDQGIRALPTFVAFKKGQKIREVVGANSRVLESHIDSSSIYEYGGYKSLRLGRSIATMINYSMAPLSVSLFCC
ncbi:thioredoxin-like protein [Artomyces pyxidatus]|uniref:Thioredoxin-like protein n=1 Tax=Artomyces pyxidatus TaxID=48021 RepID=A0ACB8TE00_9AGAM|nr:thioredoxin-like protein [Artomyces pyxidatus]